MERDLTERVRLEKKLQASFQQIKDTQSAAILGFARLTEYRDMDTGKHLERIREYTRVLALGLAKLPKYSNYITAEYVEDLCLSSVLHDVGKVGIEDALLLKPGQAGREGVREDQDARDPGRRGAARGGPGDQARILPHHRQGSGLLPSRAVGWHGLPGGKRGEQIPLSARIVALADVYDALTSKRSYKDAITHDEAVKIIALERGTHFDPDVVDVFCANLDPFRRIQMLESFKEHPESIDDILAASNP